MATEVDGRKWTDQELFGFGFNLFLGGLDTVTANIGLHFRHLATHPEDQETVRREHARAECRSGGGVAPRLCRRVDQPHLLETDRDRRPHHHARRFRHHVDPLAGRDPEALSHRRRCGSIAVRRMSPSAPVFHRCLGQHLARRELQAAVQEFTREIPAFEIEPGHKVSFLWSNVIQVPELPLSWS